MEHAGVELPPILILEDSTDDVILVEKAMRRARVNNPLSIANHGYEAIDYLTGNGKYSDRHTHPLPCFILVDLKMPRMGGLKFLEWLKQQPELRRIPAIVLTCSSRDEDIRAAYDLGAHSFITKPLAFNEFIKLARATYTYWTRVSRSTSLN